MPHIFTVYIFCVSEIYRNYAIERLRLVTIKKLCKRQHTRIQTQKASIEFLNQQTLELKTQVENLKVLNTELSDYIASECIDCNFNPDPEHNNLM